MKKNDGRPQAGPPKACPEHAEGPSSAGDPWTADVPVGTEQPWSADDAVMEALLETAHARRFPEALEACPERSRGGSASNGRGEHARSLSDRPFDKLRGAVGDSSPPQGLAALSPTDRHHPKSRRKYTRESVLLGVGGLVLCAVALMLALGVFGGDADDSEGTASAENKAATDVQPSVEEGESKYKVIESGSIPRGVRNGDGVSLTKHGYEITDGVLTFDRVRLSLRSFDAKRLHKDLRELKVQGHGVTDESLRAIAEACPDLLGLTLYNTDITDDGFRKHIGTFQKLKHLSLSHSRRITDKGIAGLVAAKPEDFQKPDEALTLHPLLKNLEELDLTGFVGQISMGPEGLPEGYVDPYSKITDASIPTINACKGLKRLSLSGTKVTDKGISSFLTPNWDWLGGSAPVFEWLDLSHTRTSIVAFGDVQFPKTRLLLGLSLVNTQLYPGHFEALARYIGTREVPAEYGTTERVSNTAARVMCLGGNGFVPMELEPKQLLGLKQLGSMRELKLSWISCPKGTDWAPLGELTQLESLTMDSIRGEGNNTILAAVLELTKLQRLDITNTMNLAPMARLPMDASEYASDNPVRKLQRLVHLRLLDFTGSSHILDSALHLLHNDLPKCRIFAADGFEIQPGIVKVAVSAGRENLEGGAAVALLDKDGVVASIGTQRTFWFNDLHNGLFPKDFKLTSGVKSPIDLKQPCYDSGPLNPGSYRPIVMLPSSPAGWRDDVVIHPPVAIFSMPPLSDVIGMRQKTTTVTLPAYDMKRWPKKEIWGTRTPDFAVRINDSKTKSMAAAIAISTGPIEDWILKGPGNLAPDGANKTGAVMAVLKPTPYPQGDEGESWHYADVEIPQGTHWLIVMAPGHKPYQREFTYEGKPIDLVIDMDEVAKPAPAKAE